MFKYIKDSLIVSALVFLFMWVLGNLSFLQNLEMLNPFENVLNDFDMTDIVYSKLRDNQNPDTNIVIVNLGNLPRRGVAEVIQSLNQHSPKVIGIDAFFRFPSESDPEGDSLFAAALSQVKNLVMVSQGNLSQSTREKIDLNE
ncbi:MAG: CHASE2 domain-containing protein, partial [Bacteroidota bacterium]